MKEKARRKNEPYQPIRIRNSFFERLTARPLRWFDWVVFALFFLFCFFSYQMTDLLHTAACSYGYLNGHILDFYDYLAEAGTDVHGGSGLWAAYFPTIYVLFAIWNLPMRLFGIVTVPTGQLGFLPVMWAKVLPCAAYLACGYVVFLICCRLRMGEIKARVAMYAFLTVPAAFFSQLILGQYESLVLLCVLLGYYYWLQEKDVPFILWFSVGVTFKFTILFFFIPLVLLREKDFLKILVRCAAVMGLTVLEYLVYRGSPAFAANVFGVSGSATPVGFLFNASYFTGFRFSGVEYQVYLVVLAFAAVCGYSYFLRTEEKEELPAYSVYVMGLAGAALFCFTKWHAHWLMLVIPFWTIGAFLSSHTKLWLALDLVFMVFFAMFNVEAFAYAHDEVLLNPGIFKFLMPGGRVASYTVMKEYLGFLNPSLVLSLLTAMIGAFALFKHPKFMRADADSMKDVSMGWIRGRFIAGMLVFIVPSMICLFTTLYPPEMHYSEQRWSEVVMLEPDVPVEQRFYATGSRVSKIAFPVAVRSDEGRGVLAVTLLDASGNVLYSHEDTVVSLYDGER
ncbi:MAG: DUF2029 domain-containing protein, partial [Lachnospiraceae bacterium]|nr:DUF2029 domain-containing protein [Lachnospiraceae bacterium]